jgi:hypothetical protein
MRTVILVGEVAEATGRLEVLCRKCDRRGVLSVARLAAEHGAGFRWLPGGAGRVAAIHSFGLLASDMLPMLTDKPHIAIARPPRRIRKPSPKPAKPGAVIVGHRKSRCRGRHIEPPPSDRPEMDHRLILEGDQLQAIGPGSPRPVPVGGP